MDNVYVLWVVRLAPLSLLKTGKAIVAATVRAGFGTCAERCTVNLPVLHSNRKIKGIATVMHANSQCEPRLCGACLQCIYDFVEHVKIDIVGATVEKGRISF